MVQKLNVRALAYGLAIVSGIYMLALGILANLGVYVGTAEQMMKWHLFFDLSVLGIITGAIEGAVHGLIIGWLIAYFYNKF